jgi:HCOMODA/2-hydroxy-3-carboxy-muconic semialdehyde decarboxylase
MTKNFQSLMDELAPANRILGNENVLDAFGQVSIRHPGDAGRYLLAGALGGNSVVPMKYSGATVVGAGLRELVSRSIHLCRNAGYQFRASLIGDLRGLHAGEIGEIIERPNAAERIWGDWIARLTVRATQATTRCTMERRR